MAGPENLSQATTAASHTGTAGGTERLTVDTGKEMLLKRLSQRTTWLR